MPSLFRASLIYAFGLFVNRALDFALLPVYTHVFTPEEYGAVALTLTLIAFGHVVYALGFDPAFLRYYALHDGADRRRMFLGATMTLFAVALGLSLLLILFGASVARGFGLSAYPGLMRFAAAILFFDALTLLPYAVLRSEGRAGRFVGCTFVTTVVQTALILYLVLAARMGVEAVFAAMLAASMLNACIATWSVRGYVAFRAHPCFPSELLRFGLPFVLAGLATVAMHLIDRVILERLVDIATVGIYSAGYRIAAGMGLAVKAFEYAWAPYLLARREAARRVTVKAIAGFAGVTGGLWLAFLVFGEDILGLSLFGKHLIGPAYRAGAAVIPAVMLAYILSGLGEALMAGVYLRGRSGVVPAAAILAAGINIGGNYLLIPLLGMMGAAYATVLSYAVLTGLLFWYTRSALRERPATNGHG